MSDYTRWYRYGKISAVKGSKTITGEKTYWASAGCNAGDIVKIEGSDYELDAIVDNTTLTLRTPYTGENVTNVNYAIIRNFNATPMSRTVARISEILRVHQTLLDKELTTLTGKSAYDIAVDNGFIGTEEEWVESLKAAGEWAALNAEVEKKADKSFVEPVVDFYDKSGLYIDDDGDVAQHIEEDPEPEPTPTPSGDDDVAADSDVYDVIDKILNP